MGSRVVLSSALVASSIAALNSSTLGTDGLRRYTQHSRKIRATNTASSLRAETDARKAVTHTGQEKFTAVLQFLASAYSVGREPKGTQSFGQSNTVA